MTRGVRFHPERFSTVKSLLNFQILHCHKINIASASSLKTCIQTKVGVLNLKSKSGFKIFMWRTGKFSKYFQTRRLNWSGILPSLQGLRHEQFGRNFRSLIKFIQKHVASKIANNFRTIWSILVKWISTTPIFRDKWPSTFVDKIALVRCSRQKREKRWNVDADGEKRVNGWKIKQEKGWFIEMFFRVGFTICSWKVFTKL